MGPLVLAREAASGRAMRTGGTCRAQGHAVPAGTWGLPKPVYAGRTIQGGGFGALAAEEERRWQTDAIARISIIGQAVQIVQKADQRTGKRTLRARQAHLDQQCVSSTGIKVMLQEGDCVGRVQEIEGDPT